MQQDRDGNSAVYDGLHCGVDLETEKESQTHV
jgi:hypothetical protein